MKPNSIHLSIRRDRNGYFSAKIHADGKEITRVPYQYGCGSYPFAIALVAARQAGVAFGDLRDFYLNAACANAGISYTEDDAKATKRTVIAHGKKSH